MFGEGCTTSLNLPDAIGRGVAIESTIGTVVSTYMEGRQTSAKVLPCRKATCDRLTRISLRPRVAIMMATRSNNS